MLWLDVEPPKVTGFDFGTVGSSANEAEDPSAVLRDVRTPPALAVGGQPVLPLGDQLCMGRRRGVVGEDVALAGEGSSSVEARQHWCLVKLGRADDDHGSLQDPMTGRRSVTSLSRKRTAVAASGSAAISSRICSAFRR